MTLTIRVPVVTGGKTILVSCKESKTKTKKGCVLDHEVDCGDGGR